MSLIQKRPQTNFLSSFYKIGQKSRTVLVIGLGNPGKKYDTTRHNFGFIVLDGLVLKNKSKWKKELKFSSMICQIDQGDKKIILAKPQTFMNLSGEAVQKIKSYYKIDNKDILIVHDELDIDFGIIRTRYGGGSAGHNGLKSIIEHIGDGFCRARIGIGPKTPAQIDPSDFVLQKFSAKEQQNLAKASDAVNEIIFDFANSDQPIPNDTRNYLI